MRNSAAIFLLVTGCASAPATVSTPGVPPGGMSPAEHAREVHWVRNSAEYKGLAVQIYRDAGDRLRELVDTMTTGTWAVVMDGDETVLDNSEVEARLGETGAAFTEDVWDAWVLEEAAGEVPGSGGFIELVHRLGGRVAMVTNRHEGLCPATRRNLEQLGIRVDVVLCETDTSQKEPRFDMVARGNAAPGLPPLRIVMWVGDNIQDFPDLDQSVRLQGAETYAPFGDRYFLLPNPMYGSFLGNPWRP